MPLFGSFGDAEPLPCPGQHFDKARMVPKRIEVGVRFEVANILGRLNPFEKGLNRVEGVGHCHAVVRQCARQIVAHDQILGSSSSARRLQSRARSVSPRITSAFAPAASACPFVASLPTARSARSYTVFATSRSSDSFPVDA